MPAFHRIITPKVGLLLGWLLVTLYSSCLSATFVSHLYEATLECRSQNEEERQQLFQQGLRQVLDRISGQTATRPSTPLEQALRNAGTYVDQYIYEENSLTIKYNSELINKLIQKTGERQWGQRRPSVIVWLALEEQQQRRLIGVEAEPALPALLGELAQKQGLPVILPLMDLEDVSSITVADVWGQFPSILKEASVRYGAQAILIGRISHRQPANSPLKEWDGHWQLLVEEDAPSWRVEGQSLREILSLGITGASHYLIGHYGIKENKLANNSHKPIVISVQNIKSAREFIDVETYLHSLDPVSNVQVRQVGQGGAVFEIIPRATNGLVALEQAIGLDQRLMAAAPKPLDKVDVAYRWIPE